MANIKNSFQILYYLFKPHRKLLYVYVSSLVIFSFLDIFRVSLIYPIINYGLNINQTSFIIGAIYQSIFPENLNLFLVSAISLAVVTIIIAGVEVGVAYIGSKAFATVRDTTDRSVFNTLKNQPYEYFVRHKQGDLLYIGQQAVDKTGAAFINFVNFLQSSLFCLFYFSFLLLLSFKVSVIIFTFGAIYIFCIKKYIFFNIYKNANFLNKAFLEKSVIYNELISGIKTIFITNSIDFWASKYNTSVEKLKNNFIIVQFLKRLPTIANNLLIFLIISLGAIGLYYITNGNFLPYVGMFGTFLFAFYRIIPALSSCQSQFASITEQLPAMRIVYNVLQEKDNVICPRNEFSRRNFRFQNSIIFKNVSFRYKDAKKDTIDNLSLSINKNTKVAIVGNSGAGKTTIANLLACLYPPTSGEILIDGVNLNEFNYSDYMQKFGYIGQETFIYHDSIKENIRFGMNCTDDEIIEAAKLADAHEFIIATSESYDTIIGDQGIKLSGGQRQRIAIARAMLRKPEILLLDEATSSLDNIAERRVMEAVDRISKDMTIIIIAHRLSTVQNANVIYVLKDGKIAESGRHEELLKFKGEYFKLYMKNS